MLDNRAIVTEGIHEDNFELGDNFLLEMFGDKILGLEDFLAEVDDFVDKQFSEPALVDVPASLCIRSGSA